MVGERGISVTALTMHLYNQNCTFFVQPDLQELRQFVRLYLARNSRSPHSLIESTGKRGYYRLNTGNSEDAQQLMFKFRDEMASEIDDTNPSRNQPDLSLSLFE